MYRVFFGKIFILRILSKARKSSFLEEAFDLLQIYDVEKENSCSGKPIAVTPDQFVRTDRNNNEELDQESEERRKLNFYVKICRFLFYFMNMKR